MVKQASVGNRFKLERALDKIAKPKGGKSLEVGIVKTARYPIETMKGRPKRKKAPFVAQVAFWNEFGTKGGKSGGGWGGPIPERPFMRKAVQTYIGNGQIGAVLRTIMDPTNPVISEMGGKVLGEVMAGQMKESMKDPSFKPNAPATRAFKAKQTPAGAAPNPRPLIDTGLLRNSISYEVR